MNQSTLIISVMALVCLLCIIFAVYIFYSKQQARIWINRLRSGTSHGSLSEDGENPSSSRSVNRVLQFIESIGLAAKPQKESELSDIRTRLVIAGYRNPKAPILFWGTRLLR